MARTVRCWYVRIANADTERRFHVQQMHDVRNVTSEWRCWSKAKKKHLYVHVDIKRNCHLSRLEGAGVNKRDVQKYLKKQQKEAAEPVNNAFAQALSGIKLD